MPLTTAFIDDLRAAFGATAIDGQIRNGLAGFPDFWAREGGQEVGTRAAAGRGDKEITGAQMCLDSGVEFESLKGKR